jgi:hypothetical protein
MASAPCFEAVFLSASVKLRRVSCPQSHAVLPCDYRSVTRDDVTSTAKTANGHVTHPELYRLDTGFAYSMSMPCEQPATPFRRAHNPVEFELVQQPPGGSTLPRTMKTAWRRGLMARSPSLFGCWPGSSSSHAVHRQASSCSRAPAPIDASRAAEAGVRRTSMPQASRLALVGGRRRRPGRRTAIARGRGATCRRPGSVSNESCEWRRGRSARTSSDHCPSPRSVPDRFRDDPLTPAFSSDLEALILRHQPDLWIHGHTHDSFDYTIGCTRVVCNPEGYSYEHNPDFVPDLVIDLPAYGLDDEPSTGISP